MKTNPVILKRFSELEAQIGRVEGTKRRSDMGGYYLADSKPFEEWATGALNLLQRVFNENSVHFKNFSKHYSEFIEDDEPFNRCAGVFKAAKADYEGGYLFQLNSLISAEIIDDVLEQAQELLAAKYIGPACVITGVALETTLKKLCDNNSIPHAKLDKMNADLAKAGIYNVGVQKQVTAWAHWRNDAAHGTWNTFSEQDIADMIKGVQRFIADYL
jgi:hypothetical protein